MYQIGSSKLKGNMFCAHTLWESGFVVFNQLYLEDIGHENRCKVKH